MACLGGLKSVIESSWLYIRSTSIIVLSESQTCLSLGHNLLGKLRGYWNAVGTVSVRQSRHSAARRLRWELMSLSGCFHSLAGKIADVVGWSELVSGDDGVTIILNGTMWGLYMFC